MDNRSEKPAATVVQLRKMLSKLDSKLFESACSEARVKDMVV